MLIVAYVFHNFVSGVILLLPSDFSHSFPLLTLTSSFGLLASPFAELYSPPPFSSYLPIEARAVTPDISLLK
jgi:hypothetical protein